MKTIPLEQFQLESIQRLSDNDIAAPEAETFLGIAYTAVFGKPTTSMINYFMEHTEKKFEELLMRLPEAADDKSPANRDDPRGIEPSLPGYLP